MAQALLADAVKAHPGGKLREDGTYLTYCLACGAEAEMSAAGEYRCTGPNRCEPGASAAAMLDWYRAQENGREPKAGKKKKARPWPRALGDLAEPGEIRPYLTEAAGLLPGWVIEEAIAWGDGPLTALSLFARIPGGDRLEIRFDKQDQIDTPKILRQTFLRETGGRANMRLLTIAQAGDFYRAALLLAKHKRTETAAQEAQGWLEDYLAVTRTLVGHSLADPERRFDALQELRKREFTRVEAQAYVRGDLDYNDRPALLLDSFTADRWIRAGEFLTYLRFVWGIQGGISGSTLTARMSEIHVPGVWMEVRRAGAHPRLKVFAV